MPTLFTSEPVAANPRARLNRPTLDRGELLVTVDVGVGGASGYLAFSSAAEIELYIEAFEDALELAREGQAELDRRATGTAGADDSSDPDESAESAEGITGMYWDNLGNGGES